MIRAFKRSRVGAGLVMAVAVLICVAVWLRRGDNPVYVSAIASVLMLGIGYFSSRVTGNLLANMENTHYLGFLHMELDPEKFLKHYRDVPGRLKPGSRAESIYRSYLADGYLAQGSWAQAKGLLTQPIASGSLALEGLYASNLTACCLAMEDISGAEEQLAVLSRVIEESSGKKRELADNLKRNRNLYRQHLNCLQGKPVDTELLEDAFDSAQYNIRRLEIAKVLAMTALRDGKKAEAEKQLVFLRKNGGRTIYKRWADQKS